MAVRERPLSPHLLIYRPQLTSILSITHRATGVFLILGALMLANWVIAAAYGAETFATAQALLGSFFGRLILFGMTFSLFYHLANGVRHLFWDFGKGFELPVLYASGVVVVIFSVVLTIVTWIAAYWVAGGL